MAKFIIIMTQCHGILAPTIMESSTESFHHHKKTLHSKRSFAKHHSKDSPTYDAQVLLLFHSCLYVAYLVFRSEEDNDPLSTDDGGSSLSIPTVSRSAKPPFQSKAASRARHQLASSMLSDDGTDSQTYDGDIESSVTAAAGSHPFNRTLHPTLRHSSSASTLTSQIDDVLPSSQSTALVPDEPMPTAEATSTFNPAALGPEHIQAFVREAIEGQTSRPYKINPPPLNRPVRVFADGKYPFDFDKLC
jgi:choline-phosphate cytidylyltransferase